MFVGKVKELHNDCKIFEGELLVVVDKPDAERDIAFVVLIAVGHLDEVEVVVLHHD